jgi:hypothetical protein
VSGVILTAEGILPGDIQRKPRTSQGPRGASNQAIEKKGLNLRAACACPLPGKFDSAEFTAC